MTWLTLSLTLSNRCAAPLLHDLEEKADKVSRLST
jgi:hypothetical protein